MGKEGARREEIQRNRAKKAVLAVLVACLLLVVAAAAGGVAEGHSGGTANAGEVGAAVKGTNNLKDGSYVAAIWDDISGGANFNSAVEQVGFTRMEASEAPEWFEREVAPVATFDCVFANSEWTLFELQAIGSKEDVLDGMFTRMAERGWQRTPSGMEGVDTFTKAEGDIRWAMLECSEVEGVCCMVLHIQPS